MILIIDNYDSFTYNLYQYFLEFEDDVKIYRNDKITIEEIEKMKPDGIVISPGPGRPEEAGITLDVIKHFKDRLPILGICLGHQSMGLVYGGNVIRAKEVIHGKTSKIKIKEDPIFKGLPEEVEVMRYHSLVIENGTTNDEIEVIGETEDGTIMAIKDKKRPVYGFQFHPESILTKDGKKMIENFIEVVKNG